MNELVRTLIEIIDIPSETGSEGRLVTHIAERFLPSWGRAGVTRIGNSLLVGKRTGRPLMLLLGHLDTVPSQGQGPAHVADGRVIGLGASDMKAGLAVMMQLLLDSDVAAGPYDVIGVFYDKEEGAADENGLEPVLEHAGWLSDAVFAIVLEPTDLELQLGCVGAINASVRFEGVAAHSARPWTGENAITKAGRWLAALHEREPEVVDVAGLEFREVATVTLIRGGIARNIVPADVEINLNYRFAPSRSLDDAETRLREIAADTDGIEIVDRAPAAPIPEGSPYLQALIDATGAVIRPKQAWTDVARLAGRGIPGANYGPGETSRAHQVDESLPVDNLQIAFDALRRFLVRQDPIS
ncbi:MAG: succinyl-diaminopimelate desuccinylase [Gammaproteobacteria bacterium]|nr:succinyl-diaminopimelate desuccinylase [Gammaproteobacteria bacterium]